jgi:ribosomal-protein-alanine N-acetyltransferase
MGADGAIAPAVVETERLTLRPLSAADRGAYIEAHRLSAEHLRPWTPARPPTQTWEGFWEAQWLRAREGLRHGTAARLVGVDRSSGALAGCFNLNNIARGVAQWADAGWHVFAPFAGRGLGTEGVLGVLDVAFARPPRGLGLHRVQANVIPGNGPSLRVAEKCGFRREGLARRMLLINAQWQDHVMFAKLAEEHQLRYLRG